MRSLPDILYVLRPPQEWFTFKARRKPAQKVDANGNLRFEAWPKNPAKPEKLLDFKVLPDKVREQHKPYLRKLTRSDRSGPRSSGLCWKPGGGSTRAWTG